MNWYFTIYDNETFGEDNLMVRCLIEAPSREEAVERAFSIGCFNGHVKNALSYWTDVDSCTIKFTKEPDNHHYKVIYNYDDGRIEERYWG